MTDTPRRPTHDSTTQDPDTPSYDKAAGGWGSVHGISHIFGDAKPSAVALKILSHQNKAGGMMCTSCAWAKPAKPHTFEFCENGAKATLWELDKARADRDFFQTHTLSELREWHDHDLEKSGRLTEPMKYDADSDRYLPASWEDAFAEIGRSLNAMAPEKAVFSPLAMPGWRRPISTPCSPARWAIRTCRNRRTCATRRPA